MRSTWMISRRTALKALGVAMALRCSTPWVGRGSRERRQAAVAPAFPSTSRPGSIRRPSGRRIPGFLGTGALPPTLEPLRPVLGECLLLDGLQTRNVF